MLRVPVSPQLISWAIRRSGKAEHELAARFPKLHAWQDGALQPTWRQAQDFARATFTPVGYFFLPEPPDEVVPIPDLRTIADKGVVHPSAALLETIYQCQQRQDWYAQHARLHNLDPVDFVGGTSITRPEAIPALARHMRERLGFELEERLSAPDFGSALRLLIRRMDEAGVMVMTSGIVGSNTRRPLDPGEFRGFALADKLAPLVFINGKSSKSAQMFTLAHELAHIWLGQTALSDADAGIVASRDIERWCNQVAAEFLVPMAELRQRLRPREDIQGALRRHAVAFKVSTLVILRRLYEARVLSLTELRTQYGAELARLEALTRNGTGGDYYRTQRARMSDRFVRALILDTLEGHTLYRDAMQLLATKKMSTFHELGRELGIDA